MIQKRKKSKQRDAIMNFLRTRTDHPTADMVYENVRKELPNISLGTVYRNLALLSESGDILKLTYTGASDRYDATTSPHYHVYCRHCGNVYDLDLEPDFAGLITAANERFSGVIEGHSTFFYGLCENCKNTKE